MVFQGLNFHLLLNGNFVISFRPLLTVAVSLCVILPVQAQEPTLKPLIEINEAGLKRLTPTPDVTVTRSTDAAAPGFLVTIKPGNDEYPGVSIKPEGEVWDLSGFGHVEARVANTGTTTFSVALRVDNVGEWQDKPWNTESVELKPGETKTVTTIFGYAYGKKPSYALKSSAVSNVLFFALKSKDPQSFRIESVTAAGPAGETPPIDPDSIRLKPENGLLLGGVALDATKQMTANNAQATLIGEPQMLRVTFAAKQNEQSIELKPAIGRWDLRDATQVRFKVRNEGQTPVTPRVRVESNGGPSDWVSSGALAPGAESELIVPFTGSAPLNLSDKDKGKRIASDAVSGITIASETADDERTLTVKSIKAELIPAQLPDWLGKRPPVEGDWVKTLDDDFNAPTLDSSVWDVYGPNYWDKTTHFSKDNVILGDGVVKLRYEKKTGFHDDDPKKKQSNYAAGYLHTYDKWVQRYGYFESRMKLPKAPGLWPAFWMMPDRGRDAGEQWKRQDTGNNGMEFDVMEHLTRWGPTRYNIAMHYDGYGKEHKSIGTDRLYMQPDKDGYITAGLLWTPGSAIYYCNGVEVARWENPRISSVPEILMFTLPMGGWDNSPLDDKLLPDDFIIDYVRVWQRKDLASPADGKLPPLAPVLKPTVR